MMTANADARAHTACEPRRLEMEDEKRSIRTGWRSKEAEKRRRAMQRFEKNGATQGRPVCF
jgi:hypothetical protein